MNGREQTEAYARLYTPDQLAGYRVGDLVDIKQLGRAEVIAVLPQGMLRVRTADRCSVLVKAIVCRRVRA